MPATPAITVEVFFDLSATGAQLAFTLNSDPEGLLDSVTYLLAGDTATDVSAKATETISITRGRQSQLFSEIPAGRWSVTFRNENRDFDPLYASSPYVGNIVPGKRLRVLAGGTVIADGNIEDWNLSYDLSGRSVATAECADALAQLAAAELFAFTATASQTAGPRINAVLDRTEVAWPANRDIDDGVTVLQGDAVAIGTNVLQYLHLVSQSDLGAFFAARNGLVTFRDRHNLVASDIAATFADDGTGIPFTGVAVQYGTELLYNKVTVTRAGGTAQTSQDSASQSAYRVRSLSVENLLMTTNAVAKEMADYLVSNYADPELRVSEIEVELAGLSSAQQSDVLQLDLQSLVSVTYTPNGVGAAIERDCIVEGIQHQITPSSHIVRLSLGDALGRFSLILDDPVRGLLDESVLTF
jgi:hypothetical protein